jgi:hypothetical protein
MVSWQFYLARKRMTLVEFCLNQNVKSYAELVEAFRPTGAIAPTESEAQPFFEMATTIESPADPAPAVDTAPAVKAAKRKDNVE